MNVSPQFPYETLYISPFTLERRFDEHGNVSYITLERNLQPTGIHLLDEFVAQLAEGHRERGTFCKRMGITTHQLNTFILLLTGVTTEDFRKYFSIRLADDLLRYTNMKISEVAQRSGIGSTVNLFYIYREKYNCSASDRRYAIRKKGDLGRYKL